MHMAIPYETDFGKYKPEKKKLCVLFFGFDTVKPRGDKSKP